MKHRYRKYKQSRSYDRSSYDSPDHDDHLDRMFRSPNPKRFQRSRTDKVWLGICGGLAERFGWESTLIRVLVVCGTLFMAGPIMLLIYIITALITPKAPIDARMLDPEEDRFWRNVSDSPRRTVSSLKYTFRDMEDRLRRVERDVTSEEWRLKKAFRDLEKR